MIKAKATKPDGRVLIVMGISNENVARLQAGQPIAFNPAELKIAPGTEIDWITLFYAPTDNELAQTIKTMIGPETDVIVVPRGDVRPQ